MNKNRAIMIHHRDDMLQQIKACWGTGKNRTKQAKRLVDGDIDLEKDRDAIVALACVVNLQLALDEIELKELESSDNDIADLDAIFDRTDDLLLAGDFEAVDEMFSVDVSTKGSEWLLTLLTATLAAKDKLPSREEFYEKVRDKIGTELVAGLR